MNIKGKESDVKRLPPATYDQQYVDITERAYNHFIRYAVVRSYDNYNIDTRTTVYSGRLHIPKEWSEAELRDYVYERHTKFSDGEYLDTKIIVFSLYPLQSAMALDEYPNAMRLEVSTELIQVPEAVGDDEDEFDRKMLELILELEGTCCE